LLFDSGLSTGGLDLHSGVFVPSLRSMSSPEQAAAWVPKAASMEWIGCYAQTELSHGSNVRGLQTTATYIPKDEEFEIHTPSLGASKWWPGGLGVLSTHCLLYARLILDGKDFGIHNFLVQIRSMEDHSPLPGVTVGDIGPKFGVNSNDNGYVSFDKVRIPRFNLLAKFAQVTREGTYERKKSGSGGAGVYSSMTQVRGAIASRAFSPLASAVTIAVRYACVRRQEPGKAALDECPILDYPSVQWRLLPQVATAYALRFMGFALHREMEALNKQAQADPKSAALAASALHATTCALKSCCTALAADGIEECRRACGGHGFSNASGLPRIYADYFQHFTPEGDNWLLTQQTSSVVLRLLTALDAGDQFALPPNLAYLKGKERLLQQRCEASSTDDLTADVNTLADGLEHRALWLWCQLREKQQPSGSNQGREASFAKEAKSRTLVEQFEAAQAHGVAVIMRFFAQAVSELHGDESVVLHDLAALFGIVHILRARGDLLCSGWITAAHAQTLLPKAGQLLCHLLRSQVVPLVDAFGKSDFELNSAIGSWDGRYEDRLMEFAQREPLNHLWNSGGPPPAEYWQYLKPLRTLGVGASGGVYASVYDSKL